MMPIGVPKVHQCTRHRPPAARAVIDFVVLRAGALPISRCLQCRLGARSCHARTPARPFVPVSDTPTRPQVDLYNRLYRERIVFLGQQISDDIANQIIGVMLYLDSEVRNSHPPPCMFGGSARCASP